MDSLQGIVRSGSCAVYVGHVDRELVFALGDRVGPKGLAVVFEPDAHAFYQVFRQAGDKDFTAQVFPVPASWDDEPLDALSKRHDIHPHVLIVGDDVVSLEAAGSFLQEYRPAVVWLHRDNICGDISGYGSPMVVGSHSVALPLEESKHGNNRRFRPFVDFDIEVESIAIRFRHPVTRAARTVASNVLGGRTYPILDFLDPVRTIVDAGANDGAFSVFAATIYPEAHIHAFEPSSEAYHFLEYNTDALELVTAHNCGLSDKDATVTLHLGGESSVMNSIVQGHETGGRSESIRIRPAASFLARQGVDSIDILKIDTEGCELPILLSLGSLLPKVQVVYLEYHSDEDRRRIDAMLEGFTLFKASSSIPHRGELCYANNLVLAQNSSWDDLRIQI